jgi:hypothetical protein
MRACTRSRSGNAISGALGAYRQYAYRSNSWQAIAMIAQRRVGVGGAAPISSTDQGGGKRRGAQASAERMATVLYRCPNTGLRVQGYTENETVARDHDAYEPVTCLARIPCLSACSRDTWRNGWRRCRGPRRERDYYRDQITKKLIQSSVSSITMDHPTRPLQRPRHWRRLRNEAADSLGRAPTRKRRNWLSLTAL